MVSQYANTGTPFDPTDQTPAPQAEDESKPSNLRKAWDIWTSHPSNNAAMLQFGLNMLSPQSSGFGSQLAGAVGGAAEASTRNVAAEEEQRKELEAERIKQEESAARTTTAGAYARQVEQGGKKTGGLAGQIATQRAFNSWLAKPSDETGLTSDPILQALKRQFPDIKTKGDLIANPQAIRAARNLFGQSMAEPDEDTGAPVAPTGGAAPPSPAAAPGAKPVYDQNTGQIKGYWTPGKGYVPNGQ